MGILKRSLSVLIICLIILLNSTSAYAEKNSNEVDSVASVGVNQPVIGTIASTGNKAAGVDILTYDGKEGTLTFSNNKYYELENDKRKEFMEKALSATRESKLGTVQKNKVFNFIAEQDESTSAAIRYLKSDTSADFVEARKWFAPFSGPVSTVLGFLCILIFTFLALSVAFDIMYLVIPGFALILERGEENKRPWGVSIEAWKSKREVENDNSSKSVMGVYLRKRIPIFIGVSIIFGWLISGKIYDIVIFFMDSFNF